MKKLFGILVCLLAVGCSTSLPPSVIKIEVPVPVPCVIAPIALPDFAVDDLSADAGIWDMMSALRAERIQRKAYEHVLEGAVKACQ